MKTQKQTSGKATRRPTSKSAKTSAVIEQTPPRPIEPKPTAKRAKQRDGRAPDLSRPEDLADPVVRAHGIITACDLLMELYPEAVRAYRKAKAQIEEPDRLETYDAPRRLRDAADVADFAEATEDCEECNRHFSELKEAMRRAGMRDLLKNSKIFREPRRLFEDQNADLDALAADLQGAKLAALDLLEKFTSPNATPATADIIEQVAGTPPLNSTPDEPEFAGGVWIEPRSKKRYDFGRERVLYQLWQALCQSNRRVGSHDLESKVERWKDCPPSEDNLKRHACKLRTFWKDRHREDLAKSIELVRREIGIKRPE